MGSNGTVLNEMSWQKLNLLGTISHATVNTAILRILSFFFKLEELRVLL